MDLPDPATVYGLKSTRDNRLRYVGQTQGEPIQRFYKHMAQARKGSPGKVPTWIRGEIADGYTIRQTIIVEHGTLNETERLVIERARASGYDLLNVHNGGGTEKDGRIGKTPNEEARQKMSAARRGKHHTPESKTKLSKARRSALWGKRAYFLPIVGREDSYLDNTRRIG